MTDLKTKYDRVPDQSLKTTYNRYKVLILSLIVLALMFIISLQIQTLLQSYYKTQEQVRIPFTHLENVPVWHITFTK